MPKSFNEVQDEFAKFKSQYPDDPTPLGQFAQQVDDLQGTPGERSEAYNDAWYKKANAGVDRVFEATGLTKAGEAVGGLAGYGLDALAGTHVEPVLEKLGKDTPRMLAESLLTIPEATSGVGVPAAAATLASRVNTIRKIIGYTGSAIDGAAATDSPLGGLISAASLGAGNKLLLPESRGGMAIGEEAAGAMRKALGLSGKAATFDPAAGSALSSAIPGLSAIVGRPVAKAVAGLSGVGAEAATMTGLNEATRQASLSVGPNAVPLNDPSRNPLTEENIAGAVGGLVPLLPQVATGIRGTIIDPRELKPLHEFRRNREEAITQKLRGTEGPVDPVEWADATGKADAPVVVRPAMVEETKGFSIPKAGEDEMVTPSPTPSPTVPQDSEKLITATRTLLEASREAERMGDFDSAQRSRDQAREALSSQARGIAQAGQFSSVDTPQEFAGYVKKVNDLTEVYNAISPETKLPVIDTEWLKKAYRDVAETTMDAKFASDVTQQKAAVVAESVKEMASVWQGRGASLEDIYGPEAVAAGRAVPILGKGEYYANTPEDAAIYGKVKQHEVTLKQPFVLDSGKKWFTLLKEADANHLNSTEAAFYKDPKGIPPATERLKNYLLSRGYDGVIVKNTETEKRLREAFGHDQMVSYQTATPIVPENVQVTISQPQTHPDTGSQIPGYVQYDRLVNEGRGEPLTPAERAAFPKPEEVLASGLPTGQYSLDEVRKTLPTSKEPIATGEASDGLLVNHPSPDAFVPDIARTLRDSFTKILGDKGYMGTYRDLATQVGVTIAKQFEGVPVDFYKVKGDVHGLANVVEGRGKLGINLDQLQGGPSAQPDVHHIMSVIAHELTHVDQFIHAGSIASPDAYSKERKRQMENLESVFKGIDVPERLSILNNTAEALNPEGYRKASSDNPAQMQAAAQSFPEFHASLTQLVSLSLLLGDKARENALATLDYSPKEVQEHAQFTYRTMRDVMEALHASVTDTENPNFPTGVASFVHGKSFEAALAAARAGSWVRDGDREVGMARSLAASLSPGAGAHLPLPPTDATWYRRQGETAKFFSDVPKGPYEMARSREAIDAAREGLGMAFDKTHKQGWWANWLYPFTNKMFAMERAGVTLAKPLVNLINDTESAIHRRYSDIVSPFIKPRQDGTIKWDDEHPLIKSLSQNARGPVRDGFNRVSRWQSENDFQPMFSEGEGGLVVNPDAKGAKEEWEKISRGLSDSDQQVVMAGSLSADKVGQKEGEHTLSVLDKTMTNRVANLLMIIDRKASYDQALQRADTITAAYHTGDVGQILKAVGQDEFPVIDRILGGEGGLVSQYQQIAEMFAKRPGYRTEQLPGEFIIRYRNKDGEVKYDSAPDAKRARYVANRLVAAGGTLEGEILPRSDLRGKYQGFDNADVLLQKFGQVEGKAWDGLVATLRGKYGDEVADVAAAQYTPGAESIKDVTSQGFQKFLKGRASQVDRTTFDYLDAMFARAGRLAASASFKTHGQMKDLILNDPSVRLFESLKTDINDHWSNMMAPTSEVTKKVKAIAAGYYLGGNLSSAAVEGSQSVMSVIPTLIATNDGGGPVKAYSQLFRAIADSVEVFGKVAKGGGMDPMGDPKEAMVRRAVSDGIIGHGVIQDLLFDRDQKTLQTAKFGQGDYGPVSWPELIGSKAYVGMKALTSLYSIPAKFNDKIAFMAGVNQGLEKGMSGDELYNHARQFKSLVTFGGGKANVPGWVPKVSNTYTRSAVGMVNTLQQYGYGMVALYGQFIKDSIDSSKSLTPSQRWQARKAFGTMLGTQVALGGVLGVPFAGAALTLLEKSFGIPANQMVREGLAGLGGDDDTGAAIAESVLNGFGNQVLGLDVSSRVGVSNLLGTSTYRGFDARDLLGPVPGIVGNLVQGLGYFGKGQPAEALHSLVPNAFKNVVSMADTKAKYGDYAIRDTGDNLLYNPSEGQNIGYALGFRPRESSQKQVAQGLLTSANQRENAIHEQELRGLAQKLLQGDSASAQQYAQGLHYADPTVSVDDALRAVMEKAVSATQEKDLLASGPRGNAAERERIVGTFGQGVNTRQSELGLTGVRAELAAKLGAPDLIPNGKAWQRAAVVDGLVQGKGMARSEALALVRFLGM